MFCRQVLVPQRTFRYQLGGCWPATRGGHDLFPPGPLQEKSSKIYDAGGCITFGVKGKLDFCQYRVEELPHTSLHTSYCRNQAGRLSLACGTIFQTLWHFARPPTPLPPPMPPPPCPSFNPLLRSAPGILSDSRGASDMRRDRLSGVPPRVLGTWSSSWS